MSVENTISTESDKFDQVRELFVDPTDPASVEDIAEISADVLRAMAQIYASGGDIGKITALDGNLGIINGFEGTELHEVIERILNLEAGTMLFDHKFMGQIHPQGNKVSIMANLIAAYMNTNTVVKEVSGAENKMEAAVIRWSAEMFGYDPETASGNVTAGGSLANIAALWVAREAAVNKLKEEKRWSRGNSKLVVLTSEMAHYSIEKGCDLLGPNVIFAKLPMNGFKTDVEEARRVTKLICDKGNTVMALVGLAGETETGMVDDLEGLADIAEEFGVHLHVDAAYGGPFILSRQQHLFKGINRADSITYDPHKMLYTSYSAGVVLFRDPRKHMLIEKGMRRRARYLLTEDVMKGGVDPDRSRNYGMSRIEGSMGAGGVISTYATIELFGKEGIAALLDHTLDLTQHVYGRVTQSDVLRPLHVPETNTLLIGLRSNNMSSEAHTEVVEGAKSYAESKGIYISTNCGVDKENGDPKGRSAFRFVAMHPYTTTDHVNELIDALEEYARIQ